METDYVVIGSGINSLVAAAELARSGAAVVLLEEHDRLGGFIDSGELTVPGFIHDTFSSWHPLFVSGGAYAELGQELHDRGLRYRNTEDADTPWVCASIGTDARGNTTAVYAQRDPGATADAFEHAEDREAYARMLEDFGKQAPVIFGALGSEMNLPNAAKLGFKAVRLGMNKAQQLVRQGLMSGRNLTRSTFTGTEADQLWAPWLLHAGLGPEQASGGVMLPVMAASMHQFGLPVVQGGAAQFVAAFESLLTRPRRGDPQGHPRAGRGRRRRTCRGGAHRHRDLHRPQGHPRLRLGAAAVQRTARARRSAGGNPCRGPCPPAGPRGHANTRRALRPRAVER